jgi:hypothetical protein
LGLELALFARLSKLAPLVKRFRIRDNSQMETTANHVTPLLAALRACTVDEQYEFARLAGTKRNYLYQLASCHRRQPNITLAAAICAASVALHSSTSGRVPVLTTDEIAKMCPI